MQLSFPSDAVVVVAGVPGAGKTTLIRRAVDREAARVVDTDDRRRGRLLYPGHYARIAAEYQQVAEAFGLSGQGR